MGSLVAGASDYGYEPTPTPSFQGGELVAYVVEAVPQAQRLQRSASTTRYAGGLPPPASRGEDAKATRAAFAASCASRVVSGSLRPSHSASTHSTAVSIDTRWPVPT